MEVCIEFNLSIKLNRINGRNNENELLTLISIEFLGLNPHIRKKLN